MVMNKHFWVGFEKNAGAAGLFGKLVGGSGRAARSAVQAVKAIPAQVKAIPGQVKQKMVRNQREFDVMKRKGMGIEGRKASGVAGKSPDLSTKAQQGKIMTGQESPARAALKAKKDSFWNKAKTTAQVGAAAGAAGIALGAQGMNEQAEQR